MDKPNEPSKKNKRSMIAEIGTILFLLYLFLFLIIFLFPNAHNLDQRIESFAFVGATLTAYFILVYIAAGIWNYLQTDTYYFSLVDLILRIYKESISVVIESTNQLLPKSIFQQYDEFGVQLNNLEAQLKALQTGDNNAELVGLVKQRIKDEAIEGIWGDLEKKANEMVKSRHQHDTIHSTYESLEQRLKLAIAKMNTRGNLNLVVGLFTSIAGMALLYYFVNIYKIGPEGAKEPFNYNYFVPRTTLVVFIETIAFFFLRLYKISITDIKYYNNEITNIESKYLALQAAQWSGNKDTIKYVISQFGSTERNHILEKGQTTVELEKSRMEIEGVSESLKAIAGAIKKQDK